MQIIEIGIANPGCLTFISSVFTSNAKGLLLVLASAAACVQRASERQG